MYITGIGDEVSSFFIILLVFCIVYFGWKSTNIRENTAPIGVLIIEQNSRITTTTRNFTDTTTNEITRSDSRLSSTTETEEIANNVIDELENDISEFISTNGNNTINSSSDTEDLTTTPRSESTPTNVIEEVNIDGSEESILEAMDCDEIKTTNSDNRLRHRNVTNNNDDNSREIQVKLKYLNDDLRSVSGRMNEKIGDFKRRHFIEELAAQKLIRLVFNGHVLQPDKKTLEECGLFDQCVVHCLIHNKKPDTRDPDTPHINRDNTMNQQNSIVNNVGRVPSSRAEVSENFLNRQENSRWYLYIGMALITITLIFCWFCRINYSYLFTFYSTVGLVLMSVLFFAMIPLILLIERDVTN